MMKKTRLIATAAAILALAVGSAQAADTIINATDTRTGDVSIGAGSGDNLYIGYNGGTGTLNVSGTTSFTADVGRFWVGTWGASNTKGTLNLGADNSITAATSVIIGGDPNNNAVSNNGNVTTIATGTTTINTPLMIVGETKTNIGTFTLSAGLTLAGIGTDGRTDLILGYYHNSDGVSRSPVGTMNLAAGTASMTLSRLSLGWKTSASTASGTPNGTLTFGSAYAGTNHLDINGSGNVVRIGLNQSTTGGATGSLTLTDLDATSAIESTDNSTAVLIGSKSTAGAATGTLNFTGGTLKIKTTGAAIAGGGGTSTLNLSGGAKLVAGADSSNWIHSLSTATIGTDGATIDTAGFDIGISQGFSGTGKLTKDGAGILTLDGANTYTGGTDVLAGTLKLTGSLSTTGVLTVADDATVTGTGTINSDLTFNAGSNLDLTGANLGATSTGILSVAAGKTISLTDFTFANITGWDWLNADDGTYTLISGGAATFAGTTSTIDNPYTEGTRSAYFQSGSLQAVISTIPEPATLSMIGIIGIAMLLRRRIVK